MRTSLHLVKLMKSFVSGNCHPTVKFLVQQQPHGALSIPQSRTVLGKRRPSARLWSVLLHRVSKNVAPLACYSFDTYQWILIFFGRNITDYVGNQKMPYYAISCNLCFCTTRQNGETRKAHFHSVGLWYTQNAPVRCLPERKSCHV